jgi:hypothetical protein
MQISFSADQVHQFREWGSLVGFPLLGWVFKLILNNSREYLKNALNEIITDNVNRVRDETLTHIDAQLAVHLECDARQFSDLRKVMNLPPG